MGQVPQILSVTISAWATDAPTSPATLGGTAASLSPTISVSGAVSRP
jgi:hypothetical protein